MIEIIGVAVGVVLGYCAGWLQQRLDRRKRRICLASAMLLELRRIERNLRELAESERAAWGSGAFPLDAHNQAMTQMDLFEPATMAVVFDFLTAVADVQHGIQLIAEGRVQRTEQRNWEVRARTTWAANRVGAAKAALLKEGGQIGPERDIAAEMMTYPKILKLDAPSFPQPQVTKETSS